MIESQLPEQWKFRKITDICEVILGQSPPGHTYNTTGEGLPFFQGKAEFGDFSPEPVKWCSAPTKIAYEGDVLLSVRAPVGPTNLANQTCCIGRGLAALRAKDEVLSKYIFYGMRATTGALASRATGSTFSAVSGAVVRDHKLPVPPLDEQKQIVEAIEMQFSRLDDAVAALKRAQTRLRRYRASVLEAAVSGHLFVKGDARSDVTVDSFVEESDDESYLANATLRMGEELPLDWNVTTVELVGHPQQASITDGPFGSNLKSEHYTEAGPRVIRLQNIGDNEFIDSRAHISADHFERLDKHNVQENDIVVAILGAPIPRSCVIPSGVSPAIVKADCVRIRLNREMAHPRFVNYVLNSQSTRQIADALVHGVGRPRINLRTLRKLPFRLPPLPEQERIVEEVERRLSIIDRMEATVETNLRRAESLRQSILRLAFSGRLV